ncbi:MAG: hypothetical protein HOO95_07210 [Gallionella sp.]|nr:hypothetical protein [Gallionella sp.]
MGTRESIGRFGLMIFILAAIFGGVRYFYLDQNSGSPSGELKSSFVTTYAECANEGYDLPRQLGVAVTPNVLAELNSKQRGDLLNCAIAYRSLDMIRVALSMKTVGITVDKKNQEKWPMEFIASWEDGSAAVDALKLLYSSLKVNLFYCDDCLREQTIKAAYIAATVEAARFLNEQSPELLKDEPSRLATLDNYAPDFHELTLAQYHAFKGRFKVAQYFAERGSKVSTSRKSLRHEIFLKKREYLLDDQLDKFLVSQDVSIDEEDESNRTLLHYAVEQNDEKLAHYLLAHKAQINLQDKRGEIPLHIAVRNRNAMLTSQLLTRANVDTLNFYGRTPLQEAFIAKAWDIASTLIDKGARLDIRDTLGRTPIFDCVLGGCPILDRLISMGADIGVVDKEENTPLHLAVNALPNTAGLVGLLVARGAPLDLRNKAGQTPLHLLAKLGDIESAKILLVKGSNPNQKDRMGNTPLHFAETVEMATLLLNAGANPDLVNNVGERPINTGLAHTQMLFHSPSHIKVKADTLLRYFSDISLGGSLIELLSPVAGEFNLNEAEANIRMGGELRLVPRAANQEYRVELACQRTVKLLLNNSTLVLERVPNSAWILLAEIEGNVGAFLTQDFSARCATTNLASEEILASMLHENSAEYAKWEVTAKQCGDVNNSTCQITNAFKLRVTVKSGKNWNVAGTIGLGKLTQ